MEPQYRFYYILDKYNKIIFFNKLQHKNLLFIDIENHLPFTYNYDYKVKLLNFSIGETDIDDFLQSHYDIFKDIPKPLIPIRDPNKGTYIEIKPKIINIEETIDELIEKSNLDPNGSPNEKPIEIKKEKKEKIKQIKPKKEKI